MAVRLLALRTGRAMLPRNIIFLLLVLISVRGWTNPQTNQNKKGQQKISTSELQPHAPEGQSCRHGGRGSWVSDEMCRQRELGWMRVESRSKYSYRFKTFPPLVVCMNFQHHTKLFDNLWTMGIELQHHVFSHWEEHNTHSLLTAWAFKPEHN
jgi:hypothetical protein